MQDQPRARTTDPATSHEAAASVTDLNTKQEAVLAVLREIGPSTDQRLVSVYMFKKAGSVPRQSESGVRTRRSELTKKGLVRPSGEYRTTGSGRRAIIWEAVE